MKAYIGIVNNSIPGKAFTSLKEICDRLQVCYDSAIRGKRLWLINDNTIQIKEIEVIKITGRGGKRTKR